MNRKSVGFWIAVGSAVAGLFLGGCHNAADDDAAQRQAIMGGKPTAEQMQRAEQARVGAAQAAQHGASQAGQQAAARAQAAPK